MITQHISTYYRLTKPGIVYGNAISAMAGYLFGAVGQGLFSSFFAMLVGICAVMASACVYNNVIDRDIDAKMSRTKGRAMVTHSVSMPNALLFATILLIIGATILYFGTNLLTLAVALFGHFAYVILYTFAKRKTVHSTLIGTISGSTPPVIGYVAATGQLDLTAGLLFLLLVTWQMPHFFSIAIFRRDDYKAAGLPILSVVRGVQATRKQIVVYVLGFIAICVLMLLYGGASLLWLLVMLLVSGFWLYLCLQPTWQEDINKWARKQFGWSLNVLLIMCIALSLDSFLH